MTIGGIHCQNHPYFPFSTASMKNLQTLSVVVFGFPCLLITTLRNFSSSQFSMVSSFFFCSSVSSSRPSSYRFFFTAFLSILKSCENLHFLPTLHQPLPPSGGKWTYIPFSQWPFLKYTQTTLFGSTPNGTFCTCTGLNKSATSFFACSAAIFSASRLALSAAFRFSSGVPPALTCDWS